jgi:restriction endonuclease S subunit
MLIKDEETDQIVLGDTLGDGKTRDGFPGKQFHYMLANPPFGVEWKDQQKVVEKEADELGFSGRFGAGLPAINDGSLLFLQHMISKMKDAPERGGEGSKIAIIFNGSPLFSGDAGSGPSNIRRWIIENDWLDAIVALPDQLFYNTGIFTYVWLVTNRKPKERRGKVQLIDGTRFFQKMKKSLNNKRNELSDAHIVQLTEIYGHYRNGEAAKVLADGKSEHRVVSRIFENCEFGFLKITVERPLRLNFEATKERIARLDAQSAFVNLAVSKKRKDAKAVAAEEAEGRAQQGAIRKLLRSLTGKGLYMDRERFAADLDEAAKRAKVKLPSPIRKSIFAALGERDPHAEICRNTGGDPEPDSELRDTENIPLAAGTTLPLPMGFGPDQSNDQLVAAMRPAIDAYIATQVLPHVPDAWVDYFEGQGGLRNPRQPALLRLQATAPVSQNRGGHPEARRRDCWAAQGVGGVNLDITTPSDWRRASVSKYCYVQLGKMLQSDPSGEEDELLPYLRAISISKNGIDLSHQFAMWIKPHEREKFRLKRDDVLISEGGDAGRTAYFDSDGEFYFQNAINRVRPLDNKLIESRFLFYWFTFLKLVGYVDLICNVATIAHFTAEKVKAAPLAFPSLETQKLIAAFLDEKTAQIDALIAEKQMLLDQLSEKRQAIITQAVTKGLNPSAPMKDSGIVWLGQIPSHWEVKPLKRMKKYLTSGSRDWAEYYADEGEIFLRMTNVTSRGVEIDPSDLRRVKLEGVFEGTRTATKVGDILITITAELGSVAIVREGYEGAYINQHLALFRCDQTQCDPNFLVNFLWSEATKTQFVLGGQGGTKQGLGFDQVDSVIVASPPLQEQHAIAE